MDAITKPPKLRLKLKPLRGGQCVVWRGLTWRNYSAMLRMKGDRTNPKMVYLDGSLWLMSPVFLHDYLKVRSGAFVQEVVAGLGIRHVASGSTTFRLGKKRGGFEPDQSYYFANAPRLRNRREIDLNLDPPPDLVIEIVYTHAAKATIATCQRLGVPEMWIVDETSLRFLVLQPDGRYLETATSAAFPFLPSEEIYDWLSKSAEDDDETKWILELRRWVADVLLPRVRGGPQP
jgi:Uma2 family endonuclease